jgi:hypothetical protein
VAPPVDLYFSLVTSTKPYLAASLRINDNCLKVSIVTLSSINHKRLRLDNRRRRLSRCCRRNAPIRKQQKGISIY